jgi:hypothetical protein
MQGFHKLKPDAPDAGQIRILHGRGDGSGAVTRTLVISMLASFVAGGTIAWLAHAPAVGSAPGTPLDQRLLPASSLSAAATSPNDDNARSVSGDESNLASGGNGAQRDPFDSFDPLTIQIADVVATAPLDPNAALEAALALPNQRARQSVVREIAEAAARIDPKRGIELAGSIDDAGLRSAFLSALYLEWARTDAGGFLADLPPLQSSAQSLLQLATATPLMAALRLAGEADPVYALEVGERHRGALGVLVRAAALEALASKDPAAALDRYPEVIVGEEGALLLQSIATGYARADLDEAVKWLSTLDATGGAAIWPVIEAVALVDLPRAIALDAEAMELGYGGSNYGSLAWLRNGLRSGNADVAQVADQLWLSKNTALLADTLSWWADDDPYGTIAWIHTKDTISSLAVGRIAGGIAGRDLTLALNLGGQFSPAVRTVWMEQALSQAAVFDPIGVLNRLATFRDEPFYDVALVNVISRARTSLAPPELADLAGSAPHARSAQQIGFDWAEIDPIAAANWAISLDESARPPAVEAVIQAWQQSDPFAALSWVQNQSAIEIPERVIVTLCRLTLSCADR